MKDLKSRTLRGGVAKGGAQAANFLLRTGCLIVFARLLDPSDFGLVGMVTAITGFLTLFREFGLSLAAVQRAEITDQQMSTLFWINIVVGFALCLVSFAIAPAVAAFYREPRLGLIMGILGLGFVFNAAGVQHSALLQRQLRFTSLAVVDVVSLLSSSLISVLLAFNGFGYWSLVVWSITLPLATTLQLWLHSRWIPGKPSWHAGAGSLLRFGGLVTLNTLVIHIAYNLDKVLLGRFWGAEVLGIYGRAYQLVNIPTEQINGTTGSVAISVLSRLQNDPERLWSYFRKGFSIVLAATVPIAVMCALYAREIILVMFGPKWSDAIPVFRLLVPTVLVFLHYQSNGLASSRVGNGWPEPEDCSRNRSYRDHRLRPWTALWCDGRGARILGGDDVVGRAAFALVLPRYGGFVQRPDCRHRQAACIGNLECAMCPRRVSARRL